MADTQAQIRWQAPSTGGLEHCFLKETATGATLEGVAIPGAADAPALRYRVVVDAEWAAIRSLHLTLVGGPTFALRHDGYGGWTDGEGKPRKDLAGVTDLYLTETPVMAQVLARRHRGKPGKAVTVAAGLVDVAGLSCTRGELIVTPGPDGHSLRVRQGENDSTVTFGEDGILTHWGPYERRVGGRDAAAEPDPAIKAETSPAP